MASVERIEQDLTELDKAVAILAKELHGTYSEYLHALGQTVRQQLILATYHVCTQGYPTEFLEIASGQRHGLQQAVQALAKKVQKSVQEMLQAPGDLEPPAFNVRPANPVFHSDPVLDLLMGDSSSIRETPLEALSPWDLKGESDFGRSPTPDLICEWQEILEQGIIKELRTASHSANRLLQQAGILPKKLPESFLQGTSKSDLSDLGSSPPNLLNAFIEALEESELDPQDEEDYDDDDTSVMQIVAIHLRLPEIEFANATTTALRNKLRNLSVRLKSLEREYDKKEHERAIAQAQEAWRATWFEA